MILDYYIILDGHQDIRSARLRLYDKDAKGMSSRLGGLTAVCLLDLCVTGDRWYSSTEVAGASALCS